MSIISTIASSFSGKFLSVSPTTDLRLGIGHYRRYRHAYSTHTEVAP